MGVEQITQQNLEIVQTDVARGLLFVRGSVPGSKGGYLMVKDSVKIDRPKDAPYPGKVIDTGKAAAPAAVEAPAEAAGEQQ
jgi:large subunit ribosomal protein L3